MGTTAGEIPRWWLDQDRDQFMAEQAHNDREAEDFYSLMVALPQCPHGAVCGTPHSALNACHQAAMRLIVQSEGRVGLIPA